ncbi:unnamed protein product [Caretta caretta]
MEHITNVKLVSDSFIDHTVYKDQSQLMWARRWSRYLKVFSFRPIPKQIQGTVTTAVTLDPQGQPAKDNLQNPS